MDHEKPAIDYHSNVDTSSPFRSVKEAIAIFGERYLAGEIYAAKPNFTFSKEETPCFYSPLTSPVQKSRETSRKSSSTIKSIDSNDPTLVESLKKLEAELEETKIELKLLKERESETEVALASLNAELHKNMSKLAQAEAAAAARALASRSMNNPERHKNGSPPEGDFTGEKRRMDNLIVRHETSPTLAQVLSAGEEEGILGARFIKKERKMMKKKPIIPLVGDLFSRKKGSSTTLHNPLYETPHLNLN